MKDVMELKEQLQVERKQVVERLTKIDNELSAINTVIGLLKEQGAQLDKPQIRPPSNTKISDRFRGLRFKKAVNLLLQDDTEKTSTPKDIFQGLLNEGFESNSKDFRNTARTMLMNMRKKEEIKAIQTEGGYLYSYKDKGSAPRKDETEPNAVTGELGERSKPTDL